LLRNDTLSRKGRGGARQSVSTNPNTPMNDVTTSIIERGDLAHLALFLWASGSSALLVFALREVVAANRRFDLFVRELARFNRRFGAES
jgi:hypothetical protein